ncbi:MAG: diphthine--ammonia ligase [Solirubrobacterales bacterium]
MSDEGDLRGLPVFCSWSGGKDSALALYEAVRAGAEPRLLVSMMTEGGERSRSHGLSRELLQAQAQALGVPIRFGAASWEGYEDELRRQLTAAVAEHGVVAGVFGDKEKASPHEWVERVCAEAAARALLPLWQRDRRRLMQDLLESGFEAVIVAVRDGILSPELLGRTIDDELVEEIAAAGSDPAGENGEYHSVVVDGPLFRRRLQLEAGERSLRDGVWFLDLQPVEQRAGASV